MSAPVALAALAFAGSAITSRGQNKSAIAEQRAFESRAFNQELQAADLETEKLLQQAHTTIELDRLRGRINTTRGAQMAAVASSGIKYEGSARQVIERDAAEQEFDALMLQFSGYSKGLGLQRSANMERMNAETLRNEGRYVRAAGKSAAAGTLLTGGFNALKSGMQSSMIGGTSSGNNTQV